MLYLYLYYTYPYTIPIPMRIPVLYQDLSVPSIWAIYPTFLPSSRPPQSPLRVLVVMAAPRPKDQVGGLCNYSGHGSYRATLLCWTVRCHE